MSQFIDRRLNGKHKSAVNRQRFIKRYKNQIKNAVADSVAKRSITDLGKGEKISIPHKDINEPLFQHASAGRREAIFPGNKKFNKGDTIKRPESAQQGNGGKASNEGEGVDDFVFDISREEFLDLYFEDLALPDLLKKQVSKIPDKQFKRVGFSTTGVPANINIIRSMRQACSRRIALGAPLRGKLKQLKEEQEHLLTNGSQDNERLAELEKEIEQIKQRISAIPFIDDFDIRYNNRVQQTSPSSQAVMFCIMDVSGSMDAIKKDVAKRFFILLYLFLNRNYEKIELVFIRHHTSAKEVNEEEFFYSRETGGTVVSSALELMHRILEQRYPTSHWNIYAAQASDGDNWNADSPYCQKLLEDKIIRKVQYFAYIEIMPRHHQSLWEAYKKIKHEHANFAIQNIDTVSDIYPVFRELFKKESL